VPPTLRASCATLAVALAVWPSQIAAQVVRGRLVDHDTDRPIARATVLLRDRRGGVVASIETRGDGEYRLRAPGPGSYTIEALRIGYRPGLQGPVELEATDDWDTEYRLQAVPVNLPSLGVTGQRARADSVHLTRVGFWHRQRSDFGHFMTRAVIEERAAQRVTDLLSGIPGVRMVLSGGGSTRTSIQLRGSLLSSGGVCHPRVIIDGLIVIRGDARPRGQSRGGLPEGPDTETAFTTVMEASEISIDDVIHPSDMEAMEVYRTAAQVPVQFGGGSIATQCGVIVIWTRRGGP
jgi:hypothetical protein